jgi:hypothetical protein
VNVSEEKADRSEFDPFAPWVQFTENWMNAWSNVLSEITTSEHFATSMGQQIESMLEASKLARQGLKASMEQYLAQMNLPTRDQVIGLAQRMTHVEMRLDDLEAKMDESLDLLKAIRDALATDQ